MVFKTFKKLSKRTAKRRREIGERAERAGQQFERGKKRVSGSHLGSIGRLVKSSVKTSIEEIKEDRATRKKAFRSARKQAIIAQARKEGRASVRSGGGFGLAPPTDIVFGPRSKKKKGKKRDNDAFFPY